MTNLQLNWFQYAFIPTDGYCRFGVRMARALARRGAGVTPALMQSVTMPGDLMRMTGLDFSRVSIALLPPHELRSIPGRLVNYTMYESNRLRPGWINRVNELCERVIVPAPWLVEVFESHDVSVPVHVVPGGIDGAEFPVVERPLGRRPYTFLALGDRGSRKGWDIAWQAFYQAFGDSPDVRLVIKTRGGGLTWDGRLHFDLSLSDRRLSVWREDVVSMADVYAQMDCFVFPTRAEGWGLPPREAAATGLPVICTNWSGTAVGIEHWAIPVNTYTLVNACIEAEKFPDGKPAQWAKADVDEVAAHMRWCYEHQDEAAARGRAAAEWLRANQTWDQAAQVLIDLLDGSGDS